VEIARNPESRIRDLSGVSGVTERTVQAIVADLEAAGYITRTRTGRRTRPRRRALGTELNSYSWPGEVVDRSQRRNAPRQA
jgi:DNA-binding MarR family transcriptional regulator